MSCLQLVSCQRSDIFWRLKSQLPDTPIKQANDTIIPRSWYQCLKDGKDESNIHALMILADMVFDQDQNPRGPGQQDPHHYTTLLGLSEGQVKTAFKRLKNLGMLRRLSLITKGNAHGRLCLSPHGMSKRSSKEFQLNPQGNN